MKSKFSALTILIFIMLLSACSTSKNAAPTQAPQINSSVELSDAEWNFGSAKETAYDMGVMPNALATSSVRGDNYYAGDQSTFINTDKIIMNGDIALDTVGFDVTIAYIRNMINFYGGYTSSSNLYTITSRGEPVRRYTAVIKVPAEHFGDAFDDLKSLEGLKNASQRQENVTDQYYDTESRLETRKVEEERLLSLISKATEINDILSLERRLSEVRRDIELYESQLKNIDRLVDYSTINVNVYEVRELSSGSSSDSFIDRIINGIVSSIDFLLWVAQSFTYIFAVAAVPLAILLVAVMIVISIIRGIIRKN